MARIIAKAPLDYEHSASIPIGAELFAALEDDWPRGDPEEFERSGLTKQLRRGEQIRQDENVDPAVLERADRITNGVAADVNRYIGWRGASEPTWLQLAWDASQNDQPMEDGDWFQLTVYARETQRVWNMIAEHPEWSEEKARAEAEWDVHDSDLDHRASDGQFTYDPPEEPRRGLDLTAIDELEHARDRAACGVEDVEDRWLIQGAKDYRMQSQDGTEISVQDEALAAEYYAWNQAALARVPPGAELFAALKDDWPKGDPAEFERSGLGAALGKGEQIRQDGNVNEHTLEVSTSSVRRMADEQSRSGPVREAYDAHLRGETLSNEQWYALTAYARETQKAWNYDAENPTVGYEMAQAYGLLSDQSPEGGRIAQLQEARDRAACSVETPEDRLLIAGARVYRQEQGQGAEISVQDEALAAHGYLTKEAMQENLFPMDERLPACLSQPSSDLAQSRPRPAEEADPALANGTLKTGEPHLDSQADSFKIEPGEVPFAQQEPLRAVSAEQNAPAYESMRIPMSDTDIRQGDTPVTPHTTNEDLVAARLAHLGLTQDDYSHSAIQIDSTAFAGEIIPGLPKTQEEWLNSNRRVGYAAPTLGNMTGEEDRQYLKLPEDFTLSNATPADALFPGISKDMGWQGEGGFTLGEIALANAQRTEHEQDISSTGQTGPAAQAPGTLPAGLALWHGYNVNVLTCEQSPQEQDYWTRESAGDDGFQKAFFTRNSDDLGHHVNAVMIGHGLHSQEDYGIQFNIDTFQDPQQADAFLQDLQKPLQDGRLEPIALEDFASYAARERNHHFPSKDYLSEEELARYGYGQNSLNRDEAAIDSPDLPLQEAVSKFGPLPEGEQVDVNYLPGQERPLANNAPTMQSSEVDPHIATLQNMLGNSLLTPTNPNVNYAFELNQADAYTLELCAEKFWFAENGQVEYCSQPLKAYTLDDHDTEADRAAVREESQMDRENLLHLNQTQGLGTAMRAAELMAVQNHYLDPQRENPRLFTEGPADPFVTGRDALALIEKIGDLAPEVLVAKSQQDMPDYNVALSSDEADKTTLEMLKSWDGGPANGGGEAHRLIGQYEDSVEASLVAQEMLDLRRDVAAVTGNTVAGNRAMVSLGCEIAVASGLMKEGDKPFGVDGPADPFEVQPTSKLFAELEAQRAGAVQSVGVEPVSAPKFDLDL